MPEHFVSLCFSFTHSLCLFYFHYFHKQQNHWPFEYFTFHRFIVLHFVFAFGVLLFSFSFRSFVTFLQENLCITEFLQCAISYDYFDDNFALCVSFTFVSAVHLFGNNDPFHSDCASLRINEEQCSISFQLFGDVHFRWVQMLRRNTHKFTVNVEPHNFSIFHERSFVSLHCDRFFGVPRFAFRWKEQKSPIKRKKFFERRKNAVWSS